MKYLEFLENQNEKIKTNYLIEYISNYLELKTSELKFLNRVNIKNLTTFYHFSYLNNNIIYKEEKNKLSILNKLILSNLSNNLTKNDVSNLTCSLEKFFNDFNIDNFELLNNKVEIFNFIDDYTINGSLFDKDLLISYDLNFGNNENEIKIIIQNSYLTINYNLLNKKNNFISKTKSSKDFYKCIEDVFYEIYLKKLYPEGKKSLKKLNFIKMDRY